jgi:hypothetical protein
VGSNPTPAACRAKAAGQCTGRPPRKVGPAVATARLFWRRLDVMKKRLLITGLVLAALLLALYGVILGTGD